MCYRSGAETIRVAKVVVTSGYSDEVPAARFQQLDYRPAVDV
jgi:hypothetical protein